MLWLPHALAEQKVESVRVRIVGLEWFKDGGPAPPKGQFAVRVLIGSKTIFTTPWQRDLRARINKTFRVATAFKNPLLFEVLLSPLEDEGAKGPDLSDTWPNSPPSILEEGFPELVSDFETPEGGERIEEKAREKTGKPKVKVLCRSKVPWPPGKGLRPVSCGDFRITVEFSGL